MIVARVIGSAVSTAKTDSLRGCKLLIVQPATVKDELIGEPFIAVDAVGSGSGELVIVTQGSGARRTDNTDNAPVDAVIMGILDSLEVNGETTFRKF